jgi:hypothetical protein
MAPATAALGEARKFPSKPVHWERMGGTVGAISLWLLVCLSDCKVVPSPLKITFENDLNVEVVCNLRGLWWRPWKPRSYQWLPDACRSLVDATLCSCS